MTTGEREAEILARIRSLTLPDNLDPYLTERLPAILDGSKRPTSLTLALIAEHTGVSVDWLLYGDEIRPCRTTQHCAYHGWCNRCDPAFAKTMDRVNIAIQRTDPDESHWGPLYSAVAKVLRRDGDDEPPTAGRGVSDAPTGTDLRNRIAAAIRNAACTGDCRKTEEQCFHERIQPVAWHHGRLAVVEGEPEQFADAVLSVLPPPADRAAVLLEVARATNQRLNREKQQLESELAAYRRAVADWEISDHGTYVPLRTVATIAKAAGLDVPARWELHYERVERAEAALRRLAAEAQQPEPDDTDLTETDIDRLMAAGVPVQIVTAPPDTHGAEAQQQPDIETPEVIHGCPPDGSGLTPCCGRTPFELPLGDRISSEAPVTCPGPETAETRQDGAQTQTGTETHIVTDSSSCPEHADDCPGCIQVDADLDEAEEQA